MCVCVLELWWGRWEELANRMGTRIEVGRHSGSEEVLRDAKLRREDKLSGLDEVVEGVEEMEN